MREKSKAWRYATALGVAYLLVFQLLAIGVSAAGRFSFEVTPQQTALCLSAASAYQGDTDDAGYGFPPCCSIFCSMLGGAGLPPPIPVAALPVQFASSVSAFAPAETWGHPQYQTAGFHARGPPFIA